MPKSRTFTKSCLAAAVREQDVVRLEIAVHDAESVGFAQRTANLDEDLVDALGRKGAAKKCARQGLALDELHDDEEGPSGSSPKS
jgi:hypothetical protein